MITFLIPAHNEEQYIADAVRSLVDADRVIVVADACSDRTCELARAAGAEVLEVTERSKPRALNQALELVDTDLVGILDADGMAAPGMVKAMAAACGEGGCGGVCASVRQAETKGLYQRARAVEWAFTHRLARTVETWHNWVAVLSGMAGVYRVDALRAVGGWSDDGLTEDVELAIKMNAQGHRAGFVRDAYVVVRDPDTTRVYWRQVHRWAAGWAQAIQKHKGLFLRRGGFARVFGAMVLDMVLLVAAYVSLTWHLATEGGAFDVTAWAGWWFVAMTLVGLTVSSRQLGVRKAVACYPAFMLVSTAATAFSLWVFFREWVLHRHLISWTGRQGRKAVFRYGG